MHNTGSGVTTAPATQGARKVWGALLSSRKKIFTIILLLAQGLRIVMHLHYFVLLSVALADALMKPVVKV
jgi:hypothetical protein